MEYVSIEGGKDIFSIGVVGYSAQKFDVNKASLMLERAILDIIKGKDKVNIEIVSGLTDLGIPSLAYRLAKRHKLKTIGIACSKAKEYKCFKVDKKIIIGKEWGDESTQFLKYCDMLIRIGGGKQSLKEVDEFKKMGKPLIEFELEAEK